MGLFDDILQGNESLFVDEIALDYDYVPKEIPYRENQQKFIANCIAPLLQNKSGRNLFISGAPGIGKTLACLFVKRELEEKSDDVIAIYVNCWKKDSSYKILLDMCEQLNYKWVHNKRKDELLKVVSDILNKKRVVIFLDEVDRVKEVDILYSFCEDLYKKSLIMIANDKNWLGNLDDRVKSRLVPELLEFKPYNAIETEGILRMRAKYAFVPGVFNEKALKAIIDKTIELKDIRTGLFLLKEAGNVAEMNASREIKLEHAQKALDKLAGFKIKDSLEFGEEEQEILDLIKENSGISIKDLYGLYGKDITYRTFHRKIDELRKNNMVEIKEVPGKSSVVNYSKKLSDF